MSINDLFEMGPIGSELELSATVLAFPPFEKIIASTKDRANAIREIKYILWKNFWNTPYKVVHPSRRDEMIRRDIFGDSEYKPSSECLEAEKRFLEDFQTSDILDMLESARIGIWYVNDQFRSLKDMTLSVEPDKALAVGEKILKMVAALDNARKSITNIEKAVKTQEELGVKVRGGNDINPYEVPSHNNDPF